MQLKGPLSERVWSVFLHSRSTLRQERFKQQMLSFIQGDGLETGANLVFTGQTLSKVERQEFLKRFVSKSTSL